MRESDSIKNCRFLEVTDVYPNSEAERIGLKKGDWIEKYDEVSVGNDPNLLRYLLSTTTGRENVSIQISRKGEKMTLKAKGGPLGIKIATPETSAAFESETVLENQHQDFKTLSTYGSFLSAFGWLIAIIGVLALIIGFSIKTFGIVLIFGGIFIFVMGIGFVVNGQVISCFISIERNTKAAASSLERIANQGR